ncbi:hypothetical protein ACEUD0_17385 [Aeromonas veronii]
MEKKMKSNIKKQKKDRRDGSGGIIWLDPLSPSFIHIYPHPLELESGFASFL